LAQSLGQMADQPQEPNDDESSHLDSVIYGITERSDEETPRDITA